MPTTIGRVDFLVDFDGKALPVKAKKIGNQIGDDIGSEASKRFLSKFSTQAQQLIPQMERDGRISGHRFGDAMANAIDADLGHVSDSLARAFLTPDSLKDTLRNFDDLDVGTRKLRDGLTQLRDSGNLSDEMWNSFNGSLGQAMGQERKFRAGNDDLVDSMTGLDKELQSKVTDVDNLGFAFGNMSDDVDKNSEATKKNTKHWKDLSHNLRQAILIVGAIAAGSGEIAVLGSAAGAGITILGAAALSAGVGLGVLVAGLQGVRGKLKDITERNELLNILPQDLTDAQIARLDELQNKIAGFDDSIFAIQRLGGAFTAMQDSIENALLAGTGPAIDTFTQTFVARLGEGFVQIAGVLNTSLQGLLAELSGPEATSNLGRIFDGIAEQIPFIIDIIGNLGGALADIFILAEPFVKDFLETLARLTGEFESFTDSIEGRNEIVEWFENGTLIIGKFSDLVAAAGKVLSGLVTAKTVKLTGEFLDNLTGSMTFVQDLLEVFADLDVFGLAAQLLNDVGNALSPILDFLRPIATIINDVLSVAFTSLATAINFLTPLFIPLQLAFEVISYVLTPLIDYVQQLWVLMGSLTDPLDDVAGNIMEGIKPALDLLITSFLDLLPSPELLATILEETVIPAISDFATWITTTGIDAMNDTIAVIQDLIAWFGTDLPKTIDDIEGFVDEVQFWMKQFSLFVSGPIGQIQALINIIDKLNGKTIRPPGVLSGGGGIKTGGVVMGMAGGGIANSQRWLNPYTYVGEAGPEAVVPLQRALSQVDPAVRALSAIAQGKSVPPGMSAGKIINVDPGAIVVMEAGSGAQTANAILDRFVAEVGT